MTLAERRDRRRTGRSPRQGGARPRVARAAEAATPNLIASGPRSRSVVPLARIAGSRRSGRGCRRTSGPATSSSSSHPGSAASSRSAASPSSSLQSRGAVERERERLDRIRLRSSPVLDQVEDLGRSVGKPRVAVVRRRRSAPRAGSPRRPPPRRGTAAPAPRARGRRGPCTSSISRSRSERVRSPLDQLRDRHRILEQALGRRGRSRARAGSSCSELDGELRDRQQRRLAGALLARSSAHRPETLGAAPDDTSGRLARSAIWTATANSRSANSFRSTCAGSASETSTPPCAADAPLQARSRRPNASRPSPSARSATCPRRRPAGSRAATSRSPGAARARARRAPGRTGSRRRRRTCPPARPRAAPPRGEQLAHETNSQTATPTRSAANRYSSTRACIRSASDVPATAPNAAGMPTSAA